VLGRSGRTDEAAAHCREALWLKPDLQGKKAEALAEFSKALAANPSHAAARMAIENLTK
jgi:tetratricopeptide (TPR) repeat protein